ncbi:Hypothetical predicted protein [Paramuricea clavata]|uniref:Uncharacterized protein n=1 Tax=Paramuricea clavata TaxID=317549 RepID=A0A7D9EK61_PARCT|nr:Hypothetical predicted protein [Paramuricea clavata]
MAPTFNRDLKRTTRGDVVMCKISEDDNFQIETKYNKESTNETVVITHYMKNAKCELTNKNTKLNGSRPFKCRPIHLKIKEGIPGWDSWKDKIITVGCEAFIPH